MTYNSINMNILIKSCLTLGLLLSVVRVIYRLIDLTKEKNLPLYYPEESTADQENLFRIIMKLLANNQIAAYEYLDGREIFTDEYRIKVREMFDRFHILYAESDIPANEVLSYYILEKWKFDRRTSQLKPSIEALCPVLHRTGDFGGEPVKYPMFWVKYNDIRPYIARQYILASNENNIAQYNYDDYFQMRMYDGEIYKTQNLRNQSLMQMYPNDSTLKQAQDSIETQLKNFNKNLWVPTPEELAKAREAQEAKEAQANGEEGTAKEEKEEKSTSRSSRAQKQKEAKAKKQKQPKQQKAATAPVRSVRRTR